MYYYSACGDNSLLPKLFIHRSIHSNHYNVLINGKLITLNKLVTYCCTAPKYYTYLPKFYVAIQSAQSPMNVAAAKRGREVKVVLANHQKSSAVCKNQFDCTSEQIGTTQ